MSVRAEYPGRCLACEERINEGDEITRLVGGVWVHAACPEVVEETPRPVCTACWLTKPCGCEDPS
jgi:hypothetical protein